MMRVDRGQGHLRVGRLLVTRARQSAEASIVDGASTGLVRSLAPRTDWSRGGQAAVTSTELSAGWVPAAPTRPAGGSGTRPPG